MTAFLARHRWQVYFALNAVFTLSMLLSAVLHSVRNPRLLYLCMLAAICTSPLLWLRKWNDSCIILCAFFGMYFLYFGVGDVMLILNEGGATSSGTISAAEIAVLLGACCALFGYRAVITSARTTTPTVDSKDKDWPLKSVVIIGLLLWLMGSIAVWYWNVHVIVRRSVEIDNNLSQLATTLVMLGRMVQPLGIMLLAYGLSLSKSRALLLLLLAIVAAQVVFGFVSDSKEVAMRAAILIILVKFLVEGKVPAAWLGAAVLFIVVAFPVFQAYRSEVSGQRGATNAEAARNIVDFIKLAWESRHKVNSDFYGADTRAQSFFERASLKGSVELIVNRVGRDVRYQAGYTLSPVAAAFIPRIVWSGKPVIPTGQLMNRQFHVSEQDDVYISPSHLGELYWNFGWPGIVFGMAAIGALLGFVAARCNLSERRSVTRLLLVVVTIYSLCLRFEGTIATEYTVWVRSVAAILLLRLMFARARRAPTASVSGEIPDGRCVNSNSLPIPFPNLLR